MAMTVYDKQDILLVRLDHRVELLFVLFGPPIDVWLSVNKIIRHLVREVFLDPRLVSGLDP
jgi:hypothetical protein